MIGLGPLARLVAQNLRRNLRHFVLSTIGIVVGIAAFVFFLGLSSGVRRVVGDIFPVRRVEVIAPKTSMTGAVAILDDGLVARIGARSEVERAFPKMRLAFPAKGWGSALGIAIRCFEIGGFADGIDPALIAGEAGSDRFKDWEEIEKGQLAECGPEPQNLCAADHYCGWDRKCHHRIPVLLSRALLELYNGSFAPSHGLPRIGAAQQMLLSGQLRSLRFVVDLGESCLGGSTGGIAAPPEQHEAQLAGISDKAMAIGMTVPIGYVRRWNARYVGGEAAREYSSIVVDLTDRDQVAGFVSWVRKEGYETEESQAERIALVITIVTLLFVLVSLVIIAMSAGNIGHTFFMLITERRREIGLLRAIGASRVDVRAVFLGEAAVLGVAGGSLGIVGGVLAARAVDVMSQRFVPEFPFKPTTYFQFSSTLLICALGFAVLSCVLGAFLPARHAARIPPAQALSS